MEQDKFKELKDKYAEGYRCIYQDKKEDGLTLELKNFTLEKLYTIQVKNDMEIGEIADFLDKISKESQKYGTDCYGTERNL
ncbi:hypothetical protein CS063_11030 [Sporanaerobium hydrogeniformans]|uniref:Uncharacterized protein n=1 Tax=Sporanaerobium hydrogeniformans TaxID=3072179 RepID=A0AC61DAR8_9FIRM|nr:hypothetical protein [Sporanaerobium hydrogeniformans]PHV70404.1 hypothetical protein CS063_11030 [Sporanaerobium hydrogeniformans]